MIIDLKYDCLTFILMLTSCYCEIFVFAVLPQTKGRPQNPYYTVKMQSICIISHISQDVID